MRCAQHKTQLCVIIRPRVVSHSGETRFKNALDVNKKKKQQQSELWKQEIKDETSTFVDVEKPYFVVVRFLTLFLKDLQRESALLSLPPQSICVTLPAAHDKKKKLDPPKDWSQGAPGNRQKLIHQKSFATFRFLCTPPRLSRGSKIKDRKNDWNRTQVECLSRDLSRGERTFSNSKKPHSPHFCVDFNINVFFCHVVL